LQAPNGCLLFLGSVKKLDLASSGLSLWLSHVLLAQLPSNKGSRSCPAWTAPGCIDDMSNIACFASLPDEKTRALGPTTAFSERALEPHNKRKITSVKLLVPV